MRQYLNRETITYVIVGVATTAIDWISYTCFWKMGLDYRISTILSWLMAVLFSFFANKFLVFQSLRLHLPLLLKEAAMFVGCRLSTGGISVAIMYLCVDLFGMNQFIAKIYVSVFSLVSNYFLSKLLVFKKKKEEK